MIRWYTHLKGGYYTIAANSTVNLALLSLLINSFIPSESARLVKRQGEIKGRRLFVDVNYK